jgi:hypothetical protein
MHSPCTPRCSPNMESSKSHWHVHNISSRALPCVNPQCNNWIFTKHIPSIRNAHPSTPIIAKENYQLTFLFFFPPFHDRLSPSIPPIYPTPYNFPHFLKNQNQNFITRLAQVPAISTCTSPSSLILLPSSGKAGKNVNSASLRGRVLFFWNWSMHCVHVDIVCVVSMG